jgi:hypothetical protein
MYLVKRRNYIVARFDRYLYIGVITISMINISYCCSMAHLSSVSMYK